MDDRPQTRHALLFADLLLLGFCLSNIPSLVERPGLPLSFSREGEALVVGRILDQGTEPFIASGDTILSVDGQPVHLAEYVEFLVDRGVIGRFIDLGMRRGTSFSVSVRLIPYYGSYRFPLVMALTGVIVFGFGILQLFRPLSDPATRSLHWALVSLGALTLLTQGPIANSTLLTFAHRSALFISYNLLAAWFVLFSLTFPVDRVRRFSAARAAVLGPFSILAIALAVLHASAMHQGDEATFEQFQSLYDVFHVVFVIAIVAALVILFVGYRREVLSERREALRWIVIGLSIAAVPFLIFVVFPSVYSDTLYLEEELAIMFTLAVPISLTVALLRYREFRPDIGHIRTPTVFILRTMTGLIHVLFAAVLVSILWGEELFAAHLVPMIGLVAALLLLNPLRIALHRVLDEALFPARTNPARILQRTSQRFLNVLSPASLGAALVEELHAVIERTDFFWYRFKRGTLVTVDAREPLAPQISFRVSEELTSQWIRAGMFPLPGSPRPLGESSLDVSRLWLTKHGFSEVFPLTTQAGVLLGVVFVRHKAGVEPLRPEERDVLRALCDQAASAMTRLDLQETVILEQEERRRMEELSKMKSRFVSSVSHDLRTPLTSITMFAEMMQDRKMSEKKRREFLRLISHETERLSRTITHVLDYSRIERGAREFTMRDIAVTDVVQNAVKAIRPQVKASHGVLRTHVAARLPRIRGDVNALEGALLNLLANALVYGGKKKHILLDIRREERGVHISVRDHGIGIPAENLPRILEPFYRVHDSKAAHVGGLGLGLAIVKNTVDAHGGSMNIDSTPGKGTTVSILLPAAHNTHSSERV